MRRPTIFINNETLIGKFLSKDIFNSKTGIIYFEAGEEISENTIKFFDENNIDEVEILNINSDKQGTYIRDTFFAEVGSLNTIEL